MTGAFGRAPTVREVLREMPPADIAAAGGVLSLPRNIYRAVTGPTQTQRRVSTAFALVGATQAVGVLALAGAGVGLYYASRGSA